MYEDKWLLGGCFPADVALLSGDDGDSGPKLQGEAEGGSRHRGDWDTPSQAQGVADTWTRVPTPGTVGVFLLATAVRGSNGTPAQVAKESSGRNQERRWRRTWNLRRRRQKQEGQGLGAILGYTATTCAQKTKLNK